MTNFNSVKNIGDKSILSSLEDNIKSFLDCGFLNIGAFINITIPPSGTNPASVLKPVSYPPKPNNTVWEGTRKDWIYENNTSYSGYQPINISGIYINSNFVPTTTLVTGVVGLSDNEPYTINYQLGQVIFNSPQASNTSVKVNYSYRYVQVYKSNDNIWWKELQRIAYNPQKTSTPDGDKKLFADHRVQLPAIIIETIPRMYQTPYELGNRKNIITQDVLLHIFTENPSQRSNLADILIAQKDKDSFFYDINQLVKDGKQPLNNDGSKNSNGLNYPQILSNLKYISHSYYIENALLSEYNQISSSLYNAVVRWTLKIYPS